MSSGAFVSESELDAVVRGLEDLVARLKEGKSWAEIEDDVWRSYVRVEMLVTKMKLRMGVERPGQFIDPVVREPITAHLPLALSAAQKARDSASSGDFGKALDLLRDCRNEQRTFLDSARKAKLRQARKRGARAPRSSSSSRSS